MAGRKRKPGARYPNGDLKPQGEPIVPAVWGRMRSEAAKTFDNPRLVSEVGRLSFHREITDQQAATAFRISEIYSNFERAREMHRSARSPNYERGFGRSGDSDELVTGPDCQVKSANDLPNIEDLPDGDPLKKKMRAALAAHEAFWNLQAELVHMTPPQRHMLEALCIDDRHLTRDELWKVKELLDWLADRIGKSASKRKAKRAERNARLLRPKAKPEPASRVAPKAKPSEHAALRAILAKLRPDLNNHALEQVGATYDLLREREKHREKLKPERVVSPAPVTVKLDRPMLTIPNGEG